MSDLFIGLMSGTSLDGVDAVLVDFASGTPAVIGHTAIDYPADIREQVLALQLRGHDELHRTALLANQLSRLYALAVEQLIAQCNISKSQIQAICCHGQTIRHAPEQGYSWQIGNHALLAELTELDVIGDFRSSDIAAGGHGAPLVPAFHQHVFASPSLNRAIINIGGIANITFLGKNGEVLGFDTGPGNMLMDAWIMTHCGQPYDCNGDWAASGKISASLLQDLLDESYFSLAPPKSTGRDLFNTEWLHSKLAAHPLSPVDVQATLCELTAHSIANAVRQTATDIAEVYLCGGGAFNRLLHSRIQFLLPDSSVLSTAALGLPPQLVESVAFAWLGWRFQQQLSGNLPKVTGAAGLRVLGAWYPGRKPAL